MSKFELNNSVIEQITTKSKLNDSLMEKLTPFQQNIVRDCLSKRNGCLSVPMGTGKTIIALILSQILGGTSLVVVSKTLLESWRSEIKKFFDQKLPYEVYHSSSIGKNDTFFPTTNLILTTPEMIRKSYINCQIKPLFLFQNAEDRGGVFQTVVNRYLIPPKPLIRKEQRSGNFIYSTNFNSLFIDEIQTYTNIESERCQAISAIYSQHKWGLSGTPFNEPTVARMLGYHMLIGDTTFPNCIPDAAVFMKQGFQGFNRTMIIREQEDLDFVLPDSTEHVITQDLHPEEAVIYTSLRNITKKLAELVLSSKLAGNKALVKKVNAYLLSMITYTRQFLVCPLMPYASMTIDMMNTEGKNDLIDIFREEISKLNIEKWLLNPHASLSSRIEAVLRVVNSRQKEKLIIFNSFRTNLNVMYSYFPTDRIKFVIKSEHSPKLRAKNLEDFEKSDNGVLFLTYELGAEGLNLQHSHVVLLADLWWNCGVTKQAIARVLRRGQTEPVHVYLFTSSTGIENKLFNKQIDKKNILNDLSVGTTNLSVKKISVKDILNMFDIEINIDLLKKTVR